MAWACFKNEDQIKKTAFNMKGKCPTGRQRLRWK